MRRCVQFTQRSRTGRCDVAYGVTADAPYEESHCKPAFWNHRPKFAPNRHGSRAPDGVFADRADSQGKCRTQRNHAEKGIA
ncbi:hypothetical protein CUJ88_05925 [Paraburkholderia hospita]|nr:hypothetical protein CUJ88_05925 [Paraburkholderia hospita]